ncbi:hypothetical protein JCM10212_004229 [Sporobolomyces blumeae]
MFQDVLPHLPVSLPAILIDILLSTLNHRSTFKRRTCFALVVVAFVGPLFLLSSTSTHPRQPSTSSTSRAHPARANDAARDSTDLRRSNEPVRSTRKDRDDNHVRLSTLIDRTVSSFSSEPFLSFSHLHSSDHRDVHADRPGSEYARPKDGIPVTAVVVHSDRNRAVQLVAKHLSAYPFVREILVWNNNRSTSLSAEDFALSSPSTSLGPPVLRIYNSPTDLESHARHVACSLATYSHCYVNSDRSLNVHLDSLYAKYTECCGGGRDGREDKARIVAIAGPEETWTWKRWRFENRQTRLRTAYAELGRGALFPKSFSVRYLEQLASLPSGSFAAFRSRSSDQSQVGALSRDGSATPQRKENPKPTWTRDKAVLSSDAYFSIWTNVEAETLSGLAVPIDVEEEEVSLPKRTREEDLDQVRRDILIALRVLTASLDDRRLALSESSSSSRPSTVHRSSTTPPSSPATKRVHPVWPASNPSTVSPESHLRAPCHDDQCTFMTSFSPFPTPEALRDAWSEILEERGTLRAELEEKEASKKVRKGTGWFGGWGRSSSSKATPETGKGKVGVAVAGDELLGIGEGGEPRRTVGFDPFDVDRLEEYEQAWDRIGGVGRSRDPGSTGLSRPRVGHPHRFGHELDELDDDRRTDPSAPRSRASPYPRLDEWLDHGAWYNAVDGSFSSVVTPISAVVPATHHLGRTCYLSPRPLGPSDYFGLAFHRAGGVDVERVELVGSKELDGVVSWEEADEVERSGEHGWVVYSVRANGGGGWEPRTLSSRPTLTRLSPTLYRLSFTLVPITTPTTYTDDPAKGTYEVVEPDGVKIGKLKLVRIGRATTGGGGALGRRRIEAGTDEAGEGDERGRLRLCGWNLDGWEV